MNSVLVLESRLGFLPEELRNFIWMINYPWAVEIVQNAVIKFIQNKVLFLREMAIFAFSRCGLGVGVNLYGIHYRNRVLGRQDVLRTMNSCKRCCQRHQVNKPSALVPWTDTQLQGTQDTPCSCPCRHLARFICREVVDEE